MTNKTNNSVVTEQEKANNKIAKLNKIIDRKRNIIKNMKIEIEQLQNSIKKDKFFISILLKQTDNLQIQNKELEADLKLTENLYYLIDKIADDYNITDEQLMDYSNKIKNKVGI